MNIIIIGNFRYPKGMAAAKRVQHFIDYLKKKNANIKILLIRQGTKKIPKNEHAGYYKNVYYLTIGNEISLNYRLFWDLCKYIYRGLSFLAMSRKKEDENIALFYGGPNIENILFVIFCKLLKYKVVFDIVEDYTIADHKVGTLRKIKILSLIFFEKHLTFFADGLIVISSYLHEKFATILHNKVALKIIPIAAEVNTLYHKERFNNPVKIVYSGSFASKDGVENLIDAVALLHDQKENIHLFLTGKGDKENTDRIKEKISGNAAITFLGYLEDDDYYRFIHEADILCMTRIDSKFAHAGFPFKLGEYLATGNPVIASDCSDVSFYLENMKDALLTKPGDIQSLKSAMEFLLQEQNTALEIGRSGREKCRRYFDPAKNGELLLELLQSI